MSGAGYNMTGLAYLAPSWREKHFLIPFDRTFDDQTLRLKRLNDNVLFNNKSNAAEYIGKCLCNAIA
ncbi:hypothetical protein MCHI_003653 [Candidatus Magnetoovum chiemensis]|nr:hypothetical protein MCHI_003653 [Candidatus Magnetoovum chiemensis]